MRQPRARSVPLPTLAHSCSQKVAATAFRVRTGDRLTLYAAVLGKGPSGIVLAAQHFSTSCEWVPEAKLLAAHGYRVLVFDYRNTGNSQRCSVRGKAESRRLQRRGLAPRYTVLRSRDSTTRIALRVHLSPNQGEQHEASVPILVLAGNVPARVDVPL